MQRPQGHISTAASGSIEGFEMERQEILAELKELRAEINEELKRYEERSLTTTLALEEQELNQQIIKDLQQQRTLMDRQIEKVERAAVSEWYDLRSDSETAAEQAKLFEKRLNAEGPAAIDPSE